MTKPSELTIDCVIFVLGAPGTGKGTYCTRLAEAFNFCHLSAGDLLREEAKRPDTEYSKLINDCISEGVIVPAYITVNLLLNKIRMWADQYKGFLIDGFPRNKENFDCWYNSDLSNIKHIGCLVFECDTQTIIQRILKRGESSGRIDDNLETLKKRLRCFEYECKSIISHFRSLDTCLTIQTDIDINEHWPVAARMFSEFYHQLINDNV
uniref:UMP-CMP kinase-like n=1 Tax=Dermatophagoides pteronyssinus TaxID=6956 RepID=A0A6P6YAW7_DERPT|nr:UMP-CMP kinase-like [Dermatophagoides pteronyssinus]